MLGATKEAWKQVAAVAGYALAYQLLHQVTFTYWVLIAGFRLAALIYIPRRYWAALALGELIPQIYLAITCESQYGWIWSAVIVTFIPIVLAMPAVYWCQQTLRMTPARGGVRMGVLLLCILLATFIWTANNALGMSVTHMPVGYTFSFPTLIGKWVIGNFLGMLTVVPLVVLVREAWRSTPANVRWQRLLDSRLMLESLFLLLPALGFLLWMSGHADSESTREAARMAMFLPVVFLALRHGWEGAAIGGTAASVAEVLTMSGPKDIGALQAEVFIAFAISSMLLLGSRISVLNQRDAAERIQVQEALVLARRNITIGEARLRVAAEFLEHVREMIHVGYERMLTQLRHLPAADSRAYARQAAVAQEHLFRLSDGLYPTGWKEKDLVLALRQGPLARALDEAGVSYWCDARGDFSVVSPGLHLAVYRLVGEALALACQDLPPTHVRVRLRAGRRAGQAWVGVRLRAWTEADRVAVIRLDDVRIRLSSAGLSWSAAEDRARSYQGRLRQAQRPEGHVITAVLLDPETRTRVTRDLADWPAAGRERLN